ncbi:MAG: phosphatase PAP2 family protein [Gemmatimonadaceae bacterium]
MLADRSIFTQLDAHDRALFARCALAVDKSSATASRLWGAVTHLGGLTSTVSAAMIPLLFFGELVRNAAQRALVALAVSHVIVLLVKRFVGRSRPSDAMAWQSLVDPPACFSFPSGHATASSAVAFVYSTYFPALAFPLMALALTIGFSRVRLGVHYPGDVLAGQCIAIVVGLVTIALW